MDRAWKALQANAAVQARMEDAIEEASRLSERIRSNPEYLEGFAAGIDEVRDRYFGDCANLINASRLQECFVPVPAG